MKAWLETTGGDCIPVQGELTIGRCAPSGLVVPDNKVSRRHALIRVEGKEKVFLVDLGSRNGTWVNGTRLTGAMSLSNNDKIMLGSLAMTFRIKSEEDAENADETTLYRTNAGFSSDTFWFVLCTIAGFSSLSQGMAGGALAKSVGSWLMHAKDQVEKANGSINKYLGDGILATWRAASTNPADIHNCIQALRSYSADQEFGVRVSAHLGTATLVRESGDHGEELIGPELNFTFRLEKVTGKLGVQVIASEAARIKLKDVGDYPPLGKIPLSGFEGEHQVFGY